MHIGSVAIFDAGPLLTPDGGIDIDRIRRLMESELHRVPRYRQRLMRTPLFDQPVWVDDARFNLAYHVRHTHLPQPGDERQLKRLAGRIMSQQLDRGKPLWEMWVVEGLEDGRFALITKAHHCMIDGVGSVELTGAMHAADARATAHPGRAAALAPASGAVGPRAPRGRDRASHDARRSRRSAPPPARCYDRSPRSRTHAPPSTASAHRSAPASARPRPTPLNVDIGPHRRFDWAMRVDMEGLKGVKNRLGGTVNDVVLAVRRRCDGPFLRRRGLDPSTSTSAPWCR